jgi:hypothetical protein
VKKRLNFTILALGRKPGIVGGGKSAVEDLLLLRSRALFRLGILARHFNGGGGARRLNLHWRVLFRGLFDESGDGLEALVDSAELHLDLGVFGLLLYQIIINNSKIKLTLRVAGVIPMKKVLFEVRESQTDYFLENKPPHRQLF